MRMTMNNVANSTELAGRCQIPFGLVLQPLAELSPAEARIPVVDIGSGRGPLRCAKCRGYLNAGVRFIDGGRLWVCNLCTTQNEVPHEYYCNLDHTGVRQDIAQHPELQVGSCEFVASDEYMLRPPIPPTYLFLIDTSHHSLACGAFHSLLNTIRATLGFMAGGARTRVGIMTFDLCCPTQAERHAWWCRAAATNKSATCNIDTTAAKEPH
jgi:protein transport protein SEC24